jgi:5'-3' exonuclease
MRIGLVDAANLSMRSWYALCRGGTPDVQLAATTTVKNLAAFVREGMLDAVIWVKEGVPVRRLEQQEDYKGHRVKNENSPEQDFFGLLWEILKHLPVYSVQHPDYEADDVIATLANYFVSVGVEATVYSNDTDFLQLEEPIRLYSTKSKKYIKNNSSLRRGSEYLNYKSLVGDTSDNVKGVSGIGPKVAEKIVGETGIDNWLKSVSGTVKEEQYLHSLSMIKFENVPLEEIRFIMEPNASWSEMKCFFEQLGSSIGTTGWSQWQFSWSRIMNSSASARDAIQKIGGNGFTSAPVGL